ncbi:hypothetical protein NDU88_007981 [Pleurodeles waltl]|uniref:Uncharacterized protein n=1 Tax=Pleurodeles waltl TaxID=8319 RepID=A0AAV7N5N7_PLEWA|nr:hypothetical protein NDU88_007981 [Pleurodeles waltl]
MIVTAKVYRLEISSTEMELSSPPAPPPAVGNLVGLKEQAAQESAAVQENLAKALRLARSPTAGIKIEALLTTILGEIQELKQNHNSWTHSLSSKMEEIKKKPDSYSAKLEEVRRRVSALEGTQGELKSANVS